MQRAGIIIDKTPSITPQSAFHVRHLYKDKIQTA